MFGLGCGGVVCVGGEWVTGLGLGHTNSGGTWGKWGLCFGCGCVGGFEGECVGGLVQGLGEWCCEYGLSVFMAGPYICILC